MGYYRNMSVFGSLTISKNTNHFSKILLAWNEAKYRFLQVTHTNIQFVCKQTTQLYNLVY